MSELLTNELPLEFKMEEGVLLLTTISQARGSGPRTDLPFAVTVRATAAASPPWCVKVEHGRAGGMTPPWNSVPP